MLTAGMAVALPGDGHVYPSLLPLRLQICSQPVPSASVELAEETVKLELAEPQAGSLGSIPAKQHAARTTNSGGDSLGHGTDMRVYEDEHQHADERPYDGQKVAQDDGQAPAVALHNKYGVHYQLSTFRQPSQRRCTSSQIGLLHTQQAGQMVSTRSYPSVPLALVRSAFPSCVGHTGSDSMTSQTNLRLIFLVSGLYAPTTREVVTLKVDIQHNKSRLLGHDLRALVGMRILGWRAFPASEAPPMPDTLTAVQLPLDIHDTVLVLEVEESTPERTDLPPVQTLAALGGSTNPWAGVSAHDRAYKLGEGQLLADLGTHENSAGHVDEGYEDYEDNDGQEDGVWDGGSLPSLLPVPQLGQRPGLRQSQQVEYSPSGQRPLAGEECIEDIHGSTAVEPWSTGTGLQDAHHPPRATSHQSLVNHTSHRPPRPLQAPRDLPPPLPIPQSSHGRHSGRPPPTDGGHFPPGGSAIGKQLRIPKQWYMQAWPEFEDCATQELLLKCVCDGAYLPFQRELVNITRQPQAHGVVMRGVRLSLLRDMRISGWLRVCSTDPQWSEWGGPGALYPDQVHPAIVTHKLDNLGEYAPIVDVIVLLLTRTTLPSALNNQSYSMAPQRLLDHRVAQGTWYGTGAVGGGPWKQPGESTEEGSIWEQQPQGGYHGPAAAGQPREQQQPAQGYHGPIGTASTQAGKYSAQLTPRVLGTRLFYGQAEAPLATWGPVRGAGALDPPPLPPALPLQLEDDFLDAAVNLLELSRPSRAPNPHSWSEVGARPHSMPTARPATHQHVRSDDDSGRVRPSTHLGLGTANAADAAAVVAVEQQLAPAAAAHARASRLSARLHHLVALIAAQPRSAQESPSAVADGLQTHPSLGPGLGPSLAHQERAATCNGHSRGGVSDPSHHHAVQRPPILYSNTPSLRQHSTGLQAGQSMARPSSRLAAPTTHVGSHGHPPGASQSIRRFGSDVLGHGSAQHRPPQLKHGVHRENDDPYASAWSWGSNTGNTGNRKGDVQHPFAGHEQHKLPNKRPRNSIANGVGSPGG